MGNCTKTQREPWEQTNMESTTDTDLEHETKLLVNKKINSLINKDLRTFYILCFGGSEASGYTDYGKQYAPYSNTIQELCNDYFKQHKNLKFEVISLGFDGECVGDTLPLRLEYILKYTQITFDLIIISCGVHDIAAGYSYNKIWNSLLSLYKICSIDHNITVCGVTLIGNKNHNKQNDKEINKMLNDKIRSFVMENKNENQNDNVIISDMEKHMSYYDMSFTEKRKYCHSDGLHLTGDGYQQYGMYIFHDIKTWLIELVQTAD